MFLIDNIKPVLCRVRGYKYHIPPSETLMPSPTSSLTVAIIWKPTQKFPAGTMTTIHIIMTPVKLGHSQNIFLYTRFQGLTLYGINATRILYIHIVPFRIIES